MCRRRQTASDCAVCSVIKPVAGRDASGRALCAACAPRPKRQCSRCGGALSRSSRTIARRAHDGVGELCDRCFKNPLATCRLCAKIKPCNFVSSGAPICASCSPRVNPGSKRSVPTAGCWRRRRCAGERVRCVSAVIEVHWTGGLPAKTVESCVDWWTQPDQTRSAVLAARGWTPWRHVRAVGQKSGYTAGYLRALCPRRRSPRSPPRSGRRSGRRSRPSRSRSAPPTLPHRSGFPLVFVADPGSVVSPMREC